MMGNDITKMLKKVVSEADHIQVMDSVITGKRDVAYHTSDAFLHVSVGSWFKEFGIMYVTFYESEIIEVVHGREATGDDPDMFTLMTYEWKHFDKSIISEMEDRFGISIMERIHYV
jgi:hypothetical protein